MTYPLIYDRREGSGSPIQGTSGEALGTRKLVYIGNDGLWYLADADTATKMGVLGITMDAIPIGQRGRILIDGFIGLATWSWTVGATLYASNVAGNLTETNLNIISNTSQEIGYAITATQIRFNPRIGRGPLGPTYTESLHIGIGTFKIPAAGAPAILTQDNTVMLAFAQNDSEDSYLSWEIPPNYAGGDLNVYMHWTNDGGVDDNGKNIRFQLNYQGMSDTTVVSGSHANSPKTINDTYTSASGWIMHTTPAAVIAAADVTTYHQLTFRLTAIAAAVTQMTGEVSLMAVMFKYTAYSDL